MELGKMTITQLKNWLQEASHQEIEAAWPLLEQDQRKGVKQLLARYEKEQRRKQELLKRWTQLLEIEKGLKKKGYQYIAGVDEAGRGPLAGPVVAASVILPDNFTAVELNDSKQLSPQLRERLAEEIKKQAIAYHVAFVDAAEIDQINIYQASQKAMRLAVQGLHVTPHYVLTDAMPLPGIAMPQQSLVKGDARAACIAAASVLAKVERDRWMKEQANRYPRYGFDQHMGYGTKAHWEAIRRYGLTPLHRRSFVAKGRMVEEALHE